MKSNLAIIADQAIVSPKASEKPRQPKATTVAKGIKIPALQENNPIFSRPFGTEGHTLGEAIDHQATVYKSLVKQRKGQLEKLKGIGEVLIELRSVSGASDKDYGKLVSKTPLGVMSRNDRADAMWLAENWTSVQKFMKDMDMSSGSATYLRQQMRKANKPSDDAQAEKPKASVKQEITQNSSEATASVEPLTVESSEATVSVDSEEDFALSMAEIAKQSGLDLAKVIAALQILA
jgi:hypothetical protein